MEDQDLNGFSWTSFFLVTSFCFFLFSFLMKRLEGIDVPIFLWTGVVTLVIGLINLIQVKAQSPDRE